MQHRKWAWLALHEWRQHTMPRIISVVLSSRLVTLTRHLFGTIVLTVRMMTRLASTTLRITAAVWKQPH